MTAEINAVSDNSAKANPKDDSGTVNKPVNFIRQIIDEDLSTSKHDEIITRFPPEPNGYLHIGHAKSICLNFGIAEDYNGICSLRFDDTNPIKEEQEYIDSIKEDVKWLNYQWNDRLFHASDYFDSLYFYALALIKDGKAYVDHSSGDEIREMRGTLTEPGKNSPYRDRPVSENLEQFEAMRRGEYKNGEAVLRAKIDMASPNINMRDPVLYRVLHATHPMTGDAWCIYPMYDFTHALSDAIEDVTHSLCTLEFEDHRPLYNWCIQAVKDAWHHIESEAVHQIGTPRQIEFSRLNLEYTITSKRKLTQLVQENHVDGWDDPRMPTISGLRRRGYTPDSIRDFCERIGVTKSSNTIEMSVLENSIRQDLESKAHRALAVVDPVKLIIDNYPDDKSEMFDVPNHPQNPDMGSRQVPFSKVLYIEKDDFMEDAPKKFFRLSVGREVRLKYAYYVTCTGIVKNDQGDITEIHCDYDPESRGGGSPDGRKVKGTIHWVSAQHAVDAEVRVYDRLFTEAQPDKDKNIPFTEYLNPESLVRFTHAKIEPSLAQASTEPLSRYQFERIGYFCPDIRYHTTDKPVFNRIVSLRDTWAKQKSKN